MSFHSLPDEVVSSIFNFLPLAQRLRCELVSRRWRKIISDSWANNIVDYRLSDAILRVSDDNFLGERVKFRSSNSAFFAFTSNNLSTDTVKNLTVLLLVEIKSINFADLSTINGLIYPKLRRLELRTVSCTQFSNTAAQSAHTPLPALETLVLDSVSGEYKKYYFSDFLIHFWITQFFETKSAPPIINLHLENMIFGDFPLLADADADGLMSATVRRLCFKSVRSVGKLDVYRIFAGFRFLQEFNIAGTRATFSKNINSNITDQNLIYFADFWPNLKRISLRAAHKITSYGVGTLLQKCDGLEYMNLCRCFNIDDDLLDFLKNSTWKRENSLIIDAYGTEINDKILAEDIFIAKNIRFRFAGDSNTTEENTIFGDEEVENFFERGSDDSSSDSDW